MTLKLEVGKTYLNKSGHKVRIICTDRVCHIGATVVGLVGSEQRLEAYLDSGRRAISIGDYDFLDLVSEYLEPDYRWFNVYNLLTSDAYTVRYWRKARLAKENISKSFKYVGTYRIDLNTGDIRREES